MAVLSSKPTSEKKKMLMKLLVKNQKIVDLIDNKTIETPQELINQNIFPRLKIDFTLTDASTYIGMKIDYPSVVSRNNAFKNCVITFLILSHVNHIKTVMGDSRTDLLAEELIDMFNFNNQLGFTIQLSKDIEDPFDKTYYYRRLTFTVVDQNSTENMLNFGN